MAKEKDDKKKKKQTGNVAARVDALVRPIIEEMGLRLWDVRYEKEGADWMLRVLIDRDEPLDTDICEKASRAIDPVLDEADPIPQSYYLEVGSPGLGRRLVKEEHFAAKCGQKVEARLYHADEEGRREISGTLLGLEEGTVRLETEDGVVAVAVKDASYFKLCDDEDLF